MSRSRSRRKRSSGSQSPNNNNANNHDNNVVDNVNDNDDNVNGDAHDRAPRRGQFTTETKRATKTTELLAYVAAVVGVVMTALQVDGSPDFGAEQAWLYVTILTVGYMISRGLAKSGRHESYGE